MNDQPPNRRDVPDPDLTKISAPPPLARRQLDKYHLLEKLGEGGMGEVYLAEEREPIRRRVALKIIKRGMDTAEVVRRFEAERQALALMDHPNIARAFAAGATENGRPYFVMEYVPGVPITQHCDTHRLDCLERLLLFQQVCHGVQHAHHKAIIHRDLKPSNILVTIQDDQAVPKIIDFGVAKATAQSLTEETLHTQIGQVLGTLEYMSPEQAEMSGQDVDTRTDVYALGVVLYELLVGQLPFDPQEFREVGFDEVRRRIREQEPQRPSTRITRMGADSEMPARNRRTTPGRLRNRLKGDLDLITMQAMAKDRTRRYGSPAELAADIDRYLTDRPVLAGSPGMSYRLGKFVKRHQVGVGAAASILVLLIALATSMTIQAERTAKERDRALAAESRARAEAETAAEVSAFLIELFRVSDPGEARGNSVTAREILDRGAVRIEETLGDQPGIQAQLMETIGSVYLTLGLYEPALELADRAVAIRRSIHGTDHPEILTSLMLLAQVRIERGELDLGEALNREVVAMSRRIHGDHHAVTADCIQDLAINLARQNRRDEAEVLYREALAARRGQDSPDTMAVASTLTSLGELLRRQNRLDDAEAAHLEALALAADADNDLHPIATSIANNLALVYESREDLDAAEAILREVLQRRLTLYGEQNPEYATSLSNLAGVLKKQDKIEEAEQMHRKALAIRQATLRADHPEVAASLNNLSTVLQGRGAYDEAAELLNEALVIIRATMGADHPRVGITLSNLGILHDKRGDYAEALRCFREAEPILLTIMPADHWRMGNFQNTIGLLLAHEGRFEEGEAELLAGYEIVKNARGDGDSRTRKALSRVVKFYQLADRDQEFTQYKELLNATAPGQ